ncbi:MAG: S41 family peptidase [Bryobacter sp.]|jgi:carboxyl-terminal processing protease|nr:S41 family peptidase [Bryobacter sp.]
MPQFEKAVKECLRCDGFIIDLRGNPGGLGAMAMGMAGFFVEEQGKQLGVMTQREMSLNFIVTPRAETYSGPLAILVDGGSGSTAEIFVGGMQDLGRAKVFGTATMGAALPSMFTRLPNGDGFQYAVADYVSQSGRRLEGGGVLPDVATPLTRKALLEGKDPALDAALNWIHEQSRSRSGASRPPAARRGASAAQR